MMPRTVCDPAHEWTAPDLPALIGRSRSMRALVDGLARAARSDAKVLLTGESGVGKEIVARQIHRLSSRARAPLVTLNCAGMPDTLLESELFGHTRGSFTGALRDKPGLLETADAGTLFLDEVAETSLRMQGVLLRFLETGEIRPIGSVRRETRVNVRIIAATNRRLRDAIRDGAFRSDLYYRLNVIHLTIPSLRERREDIRLLVSHYLRAFGEQYRAAPCTLRPETLAYLEEYDWPGNVRELKNVMERLVVTCDGEEVGLEQLPPDLREGLEGAPAPAAVPLRSTADEKFDAMVRDGESFWSAVYEPFIARDLTRADVRQLVERGLRETAGNYRMLVARFNIDPAEYRRFLNFLRKHNCHMAFQAFRAIGEERSAAEASCRERAAADVGHAEVSPSRRRAEDREALRIPA